MTYSAQTRDRFRLAVAAVTGVTTVAALSATGWLAGAAAHDSEALQQEEAAVAQAKYRSDLAAWRKATAAAAQQQRPRVELRDRPQRTETTLRYVQGTGASAVGTGGQVSAAPRSGQSQSAQPPSAPPPPPAPAPGPAAPLRAAGPEMTTATFETWGTYVFLGTRDPADLGHAHRLATGILADIGRACSRFRADSDLTRANAHPGRWVEVDPLLVTAVSVACEAADQTDGLVNPLLGRHLVQLGYDRDFGLLVECEDEILLPDVTAVPDVDAWRRIGLDAASAIRVPTGTALDLGATAKAWAADVIAAAFESELAGSAVISVGGDLAVAAADDEPWPVAISERPGAAADQTVLVHGGGLATSSTRVRRWRRGGTERHHLLDPRTGQPVPDARRTVTATGPTCTAANTASTAAVVLGTDAEAWLTARGVTARLVDDDGVVHTTGAWPVNLQQRTFA